MTKKYAFVKFFFGFAVLAALLLQSAHALHHLEEEFSKTHCHHKKTQNKAELTHSHENESCFVCSFTFGQTGEIQFPHFNLLKKQSFNATVYGFSKLYPNAFNGAFFSLRAPPVTV